MAALTIRFFVAIAITLAACGSPEQRQTRPAPTTRPDAGVAPDATASEVSAPTDPAQVVVHEYAAPRADGTHGAVCAWGDQSAGEPWAQTQPAECGAKLYCCYPCGIDGCDRVCATEKECASWRTLP